jgi:dipeptidase E
MTEQSKKNMLLLSGSKAAGNLPDGQKPGFLDWAETWIKDFFAKQIEEKKPVVFVPYARPDGISEQEYFNLVKARLGKMGVETICASTDGVTDEILKDAGGIFIGGGHTPTLLYKLQQTGSIEIIRKHVENGLPYMGSSAGTLVTCPTIKTNNDMPGPANDVIDLRSLGLIGAQLNCHYMDNSMHDPKHQGETRDTRLKEFCTFNPGKAVLGLYEGQALRVRGDDVELWTSEQARGKNTPVFINNDRTEIKCEIGVAENVSRIFEIREKNGFNIGK